MDAERIAAYYAQAPGASLTNLTLALLVVVVMSGRVAPALLFGWLALVVLTHVLRLSFWHARRREADPSARWRHWAGRSTLAMLSSGLVWGGGSVAMFDPAQPLLAAFWLILITGIGAGVVAANAFHLPALWAYLFPLLLPNIARIAYEGGTEYLAIASGLLLYLVFCVGQGRHQARLVLDTLRMRHDNQALVEQLKVEKQIAEAARKLAEESNAARSRFFAAASHDLRQPLHAISLSSATLTHAALPANEMQAVERISESATTLGDLFDELLDLARLDAKAITPQPRPLPVQTILDHLEMLFAPVAIDENTRLYLKPSSATVCADDLLAGRILGNFISNGLKYARGGTVAVFCRRRGENLVVEVRDNGSGIPLAAQQRIFDEFYQLDNPNRDSKRGFGLGLATTRHIADLLGVQLGLRSQPGRGSVFWVSLPLDRAADPSGPLE